MLREGEKSSSWTFIFSPAIAATTTTTKPELLLVAEARAREPDPAEAKMPFGRAILSTSLLFLFKRLGSPAVSELGKLHGVEEELEELRRTLGALLHDAERRSVEGELAALRLRELADVALDAEDVVDEFEYEDLRRRVESGGDGGSVAGKGKVSGQPPSSPPRGTHTASFLKEMSRRMDVIRERLGEISKAKKELDLSDVVLHVGQDQPASSSSRSMKETGSILPEPDVFGRVEEKNKLRELLLGTTGDAPPSPRPSVVRPTSLSVLSIVGMGGLGKTTLAQWAYNTREFADYFHLRMWVWVSHDFDLKRVTKQILEHVVHPPQSGLQNVDDLDVLQQNLVEGLEGKRFLLVLDDVWEEDQAEWCEFFAPLGHGQHGSKVMITTRHAKVADVVQSVKIELGKLPFEHCRSIFKRHAFPEGNSDEHPSLDSLGEEIVKKVKGIPLAARTLGGLLRFESTEEVWRDVLQSELWESEEGDGGIMPALRVSYEYLPPHLKRCFAYCSVFPKGRGFGMLELVQLWMAQGYVQPQEKKAVEDAGRHYLNELIGRSLIQFDSGKFVLHDLLHDLGQLTLQHDFCEIKGDDVQRIPEDAHSKRHLLLCYEKSTTTGELKVLYEFRRLHTFLLKLSSSTNKVLFQVPFDLSDYTMLCLRVLDLSYCGIETLPESIDCLRHLRFLSLRRAPVKCLPGSLCSLYMLQTLLLQECDQLDALPERMSNLISLHYLEAEPKLVASIVGIGKLTHLQNLQVFSVSEGNGNKIGELRDLNQLRGKLCIQNLHRVGGREEAIEAALEDKQYLESLEMEWASDRDVDQIDCYLEESVLEGLKPPTNLNELIVKCYAGINLPMWMNKSLISNLELIHSHRCIDLSHLPTALMNLTLLDVKLNALPDSLCHLPLKKLVICQIPELREMPLLPATLKELTIESVGLESLPEFDQGHGLLGATPAGCDEDGGSCDGRKPSLSILKIHGCPHLKTLHEGFLQHHLRHLRVLSIKDCKELVSWPEGEGFLATLYSLEEELSIEDCPKVEPLPEGSKLPTSLKKLSLTGCLGIPGGSLFSQLDTLNCDDVFMGKFYYSLEYCSYEMLRRLKTVDSLGVNLFRTSGITSPLVVASYNRERAWSRTLEDHYLAPRVTLVIMVPLVDGGVVADDGGSQLLSMCLGGHAWASSLRNLTLDSIPEKAILSMQHEHHHDSISEEEEEDDEATGLQPHPVRFPLLERLCICRCREMRALPTEMMQCHMTSLKDLFISDCPELTLPSLQEGIQCLPSLDELHVYNCPQLLVPQPSTPPSPPPLSLPATPTLRNLSTDDVRLLPRLLVSNSTHHGRGGSDSTGGHPLRDHLLGSLFSLRVEGCGCTSIAGEVEVGLRTLAPSLQKLALLRCPSLGSLPVDLRDLLPNLRALYVENCPAIQCLPERGVPDSLLLLRINLCPVLAECCRPLPPAISHVPLVAIDQEFVRGSYFRLLDLQAKFDILF